MLTSATREKTLTINPNECNSILTSGTNNIYPYPYIDVNDRGHRFRSGSPLTNYPHARATPEDSHNVVAPGVGFSLLGLAQGSARGLSRGSADV